MVLNKDVDTSREDEDEAVAVLSAAVLARSMGSIHVATSLEKQLRECGYVRACVEVRAAGDPVEQLLQASEPMAATGGNNAVLYAAKDWRAIDTAASDAGRSDPSDRLTPTETSSALSVPSTATAAGVSGSPGASSSDAADPAVPLPPVGGLSSATTQITGSESSDTITAPDGEWSEWGTVLVQEHGASTRPGALAPFAIEPTYSVMRGAQLPPGTLVCSGSFRPFHAGHEQMMEAARGTVARRLRAEAEAETAGAGAGAAAVPAGRVDSDGVQRTASGSAGAAHGQLDLPPCVFELAVRNADKPSVSADQLRGRVGQFVDPVALLGLLDDVGARDLDQGGIRSKDSGRMEEEEEGGEEDADAAEDHEAWGGEGQQQLRGSTLGLEDGSGSGSGSDAVSSADDPDLSPVVAKRVSTESSGNERIGRNPVGAGRLGAAPLVRREQTLSGGGLMRKYGAPVTGVSGRRWPIVCTPCPYFHGKAQLFPECWFVIGYDTAVRVLDPKYYGGTREGLAVALSGLRQKGCRFVVAGRDEKGEGEHLIFRTAKDLEDRIPAVFRDGLRPMFVGMSEEAFHLRRSSSQIRNAAATAACAAPAVGDA